MKYVWYITLYCEETFEKVREVAFSSYENAYNFWEREALRAERFPSIYTKYLDGMEKELIGEARYKLPIMQIITPLSSYFLEIDAERIDKEKAINWEYL